MSDENQPNTPRQNYPPVVKNAAATDAEEYLGKLCKKSFLSLWSYPGVFRDQGQPKPGADGKEVCDLLVVFGDFVIIFSDKHCAFRTDDPLEVAWSRWFRKAIVKSADQIWGAKRWIEQHPTRVFLDKKCSQRLPLTIRSSAKFYLVVVAHGVSPHVAKMYGGSGSLFINSSLRGFNAHNRPFFLGDLDPAQTFVHVLDDDSLDTLMGNLDTMTDFVNYLDKREKVLRSNKMIVAAGEEELLASYLQTLTKTGEHDFAFFGPNMPPCIALDEGLWEEFQRHPQRTAQIKANKVSYIWDALIERFAEFALRGQQYFVTKGGFLDAETILFFMAQEPRYVRRVLGERLHYLLRKSTQEQRMLSLVTPATPSSPYYVFLLFPPPEQFPSVTKEQYRVARMEFLKHSCCVARLIRPDAKDIVGIATEAGLDSKSRSEDSCYLDGRVWGKEAEAIAKDLQRDLSIFVNYKETHTTALEAVMHLSGR